MPSKKRGSAYYLARLKREHPSIYADYRSGKHTSVRAAATAAGLIQLPTPLTILRREWRKASLAEKRAFIAELKVKAAKPAAILTPDRRLLPSIQKRIEHIMTVRGLKMGQVMIEMGCFSRNPALARALRGDRLGDYVAIPLAKWLDANRGV